MKIKVADIILIIVLTLGIIGGMIWLYFPKNNNYSSTYAIVLHNNEEILRIDFESLDETTEYIIQGDVSEMTIMANKSGVWVAKSECYGHDCIHMGITNSPDKIISCLPNDVIIKIVGEGEILS